MHVGVEVHRSTDPFKVVDVGHVAAPTYWQFFVVELYVPKEHDGASPHFIHSSDIITKVHCIIYILGMHVLQDWLRLTTGQYMRGVWHLSKEAVNVDP